MTTFGLAHRVTLGAPPLLTHAYLQVTNTTVQIASCLRWLASPSTRTPSLDLGTKRMKPLAIPTVPHGLIFMTFSYPPRPRIATASATDSSLRIFTPAYTTEQPAPRQCQITQQYPQPPPRPQAKDAAAAAARKRRRRAPAGGAADDCFSCSKKSVKCDRKRPYCSQCLQVGSECSGYKTQLTWGVGVASRGKLRGLSLPVWLESAPAGGGSQRKSPQRSRSTSSVLSARMERSGRYLQG